MATYNININSHYPPPNPPSTFVEDSQEKQQIKEAINLFYSAHQQLSEGINRITQISMRSPDSHLYLPILSSMQMQMQNVSMQINYLIQQAGLLPIEQSQIQPSPTPIAGAGMPQSLSVPLWNGMGGVWPGNSYLAPPRPIQQAYSPELGAGNGQIQGPLSPVPVIEKANSPSNRGQSLKRPLENPFDPPKAKRSHSKPISDEQSFIDAIKIGTLRALDKYSQPTNVDVVMDENGNTPLLWIIRNHPHPTNLVKTLLEWGANPNAQNNDGQTALHLALQNGTVKRRQSMEDVIKQLLERGALADTKDKQGRTPSESATTHAGISILNRCLHKEGTSNQNQWLKRPIKKPLEGDALSKVVPTFSDEQYLIDAIKKNNKADILTYITCIKNANIFIDEEKNTPLLWVIKNYPTRQNLAKLLLQNGANPNTQNNQGETALHLIVEFKNRIIFGTIRELIKNGALIDIKNQRGQTPLQLAAEQGRIRLVKFLQKTSALINIKDAKNQFPVDTAVELAKSVFESIKDKKETKMIPRSDPPSPIFLTSENSEEGDSEEREARNEEATTTNNLQVKTNEDLQEEDGLEKLFGPIEIEEEEWFFKDGF